MMSKSEKYILHPAVRSFGFLKGNTRSKGNRRRKGRNLEKCVLSQPGGDTSSTHLTFSLKSKKNSSVHKAGLP